MGADQELAAQLHPIVTGRVCLIVPASNAGTILAAVLVEHVVEERSAAVTNALTLAEQRHRAIFP